MRNLFVALLACLAPLTLYAAEDQSLQFGRGYPLVINISHGQKVGAMVGETPFSAEPGGDYDTVFIQGEMPEAGVRLDVTVKGANFLSADSRYGYTAIHRNADGRFWAKYTLNRRSASPLKLSAYNSGLKAASPVTLYEVETVDSRDAGEPRVSTEAFVYTPDPSLSVPENAPFPIIRRADWQALPPKQAFSTHTPVALTLHHTQGRYPQTLEAALSEIRFIQDFHQNGRGWIDIGYQFLVDPSGNIFEGRPVGAIGAHVRNKNTGNIGISVMGNYHPPVSDAFTDASRDAFTAVGLYLRRTFGVQRDAFKAHRDQQDTDCPGDDLYAKMEYLRGLVFDPALDVLPAPSQPAPRNDGQLQQNRAVRQLMDFLN